jgi:squalene-hopene/tetraprenyl-beta-curcumene cyclase
VSPLPFELACLPQSWYRFARLPVVSYAIPALVAIGQARYFHRKPWNPIARVVRAASVERSLKVLQKMQPASGGFLEATPLTSFVVMSLASIGRHDHPVTQLGLKFLLDSVRPDGSWPIDTNLATWVTTLSINALTSQKVVRLAEYKDKHLMNWILDCQHSKPHPFTGATPGGWGWSDLSGAVPDADDTPGTLMAISNWNRDHQPTKELKWDNFDRTDSAVEMGFNWLVGLQNRDGGWPTFCRGWGKLPFDRSGTDLTAHVVRALKVSSEDIVQHYEAIENAKLMVDALLFGGDRFSDAIENRTKTKESLDCQTKAQNAIGLGLQFLGRSQRPDGSWLPLWFGNQHRPEDENPLYGTAKVLLAYRDLGRMQDEPARRGVAYLLTQQNADGGWGGDGSASSVEETALVVEALLAAFDRPAVHSVVERGLQWLVEAVESGRFRTPSPIGFYFAKLWYYEKLYPLIFTVGALRTAVERIETHPA